MTSRRASSRPASKSAMRFVAGSKWRYCLADDVKEDRPPGSRERRAEKTNARLRQQTSVRELQESHLDADFDCSVPQLTPDVNPACPSTSVRFVRVGSACISKLRKIMPVQADQRTPVSVTSELGGGE